MRWKAYLFGASYVWCLEEERKRDRDGQTDRYKDRDNSRQKDRETRKEAGRRTTVSVRGGHITVEYQTDTKIENPRYSDREASKEAGKGDNHQCDRWPHHSWVSAWYKDRQKEPETLRHKKTETERQAKKPERGAGGRPQCDRWPHHRWVSDWYKDRKNLRYRNRDREASEEAIKGANLQCDMWPHHSWVSTWPLRCADGQTPAPAWSSSDDCCCPGNRAVQHLHITIQLHVSFFAVIGKEQTNPTALLFRQHLCFHPFLYTHKHQI